MSDPNNRLMTVQERKAFASTIPAGSIVEFICGLPGPDCDWGLYLGEVNADGAMKIHDTELLSPGSIEFPPSIYRGRPNVWVKRRVPDWERSLAHWNKLQADRERLGWSD